MKVFLFLVTGLFLLSGDALEKARQGERERIAGRPPLAPEAREAWRPAGELPGMILPPVVSLELDVVPFGFAGLPWTKEDVLAELLESVRRYFHEQSDGRFTIDVRMHPAALLRSTREDTARCPMGGRQEREMVSRLIRKTGADRSRLLFVAAGRPGPREGVLWPHGGIAGTDRYALTTIDVQGWEKGALAHELMHLYDLPDKYEMETGAAGEWCLMGTGYRSRGEDGKPEPGPLCVVCRHRLGWVTLREASLSGESRLALDPVGDSLEGVRVPLNRDASDALVLEGRRGKGLLVWHVQSDRVPAFLGCFPTEASDRLTPWSEPAFRSDALGSRPVCLTDVRFEEGKSWFTLATDAEWTPLERLHREASRKLLGE